MTTVAINNISRNSSHVRDMFELFERHAKLYMIH